MLFKNSFHLLVDNFSLNYKFLLYKLIVWLIGLALSAALLYPTLRMLFTSEAFEGTVQLFKDFLHALVSGDTEFLTGFAENLQAQLNVLIDFFREKTPNVVFFFVALVLIWLLNRFLGGVGNFAFGGLIDHRMSSYAKIPFMNAFIGGFGKACLWQVIYVPLSFLFNAAVVALCYVVFIFLLSVIAVKLVATVAALMVSVALLVAAQAVKLTLCNDVVPAMVSDKAKLRTALKKSFSFKEKGRFGALFSTYLVTAMLILCVNVLFALSSFGAALLITVPMSYLILICIQFVGYYTYGKKKYFLGEDQIVSPKCEKKEENFYDDFEL